MFVRSRTTTRGSPAILRVELPVADVDAVDPRRARLEQAIREPARRRAHVQRHPPRHVDPERRQRCASFTPAARNIRASARAAAAAAHPDATSIARLVDRPIARQHLPGQDQRPRPLARRRQPLLDKQGPPARASNQQFSRAPRRQTTPNAEEAPARGQRGGPCGAEGDAGRRAAARGRARAAGVSGTAGQRELSGLR